MPSDFENLDVYKRARELRKRVSMLIKQLPEVEKFNLMSQMRRASLSVTNNIAVGHGSQSYRHNISYLYKARGSVYELMDDLIACNDEGYFQAEHLDDLKSDMINTVMVINGYIRYLEAKLPDNRSRS